MWRKLALVRPVTVDTAGALLGAELPLDHPHGLDLASDRLFLVLAVDAYRNRHDTIAAAAVSPSSPSLGRLPVPAQLLPCAFAAFGLLVLGQRPTRTQPSASRRGSVPLGVMVMLPGYHCADPPQARPARVAFPAAVAAILGPYLRWHNALLSVLGGHGGARRPRPCASVPDRGLRPPPTGTEGPGAYGARRMTPMIEVCHQGPLDSRHG